MRSSGISSYLLVSLLVFGPVLVHAQSASGSSFAKGMVIYKATVGEQPHYYSAALFRSTRIATPWMEYDVGESKPLFVQSGFVVQEISFGGMFDADFVNDEQAAACERMQQTLEGASRASPKVVPISRAVIEVIEKQLVAYRSGKVRFGGKWLSREAYLGVMKERTAAEQREKAALAAAHASSNAMSGENRSKAQELENADRQRRAQRKAADDDLAKVDAPGVGKLLLEGYDSLMVDAQALRSAGKRPVGTTEGGFVALSQKLPGGDNGAILSGLHLGNAKGGCAMLWAREAEKLLAADVGLFVETDLLKEALSNSGDVAHGRALLACFDEQLVALIPDVLAAAKIRAVLRTGTGRNVEEAYSGFDRQTEKHSIRILVGAAQTLDDGSFRQPVIFQIRPR